MGQHKTNAKAKCFQEHPNERFGVLPIDTFPDARDNFSFRLDEKPDKVYEELRAISEKYATFSGSAQDLFIQERKRKVETMKIGLSYASRLTIENGHLTDYEYSNILSVFADGSTYWEMFTNLMKVAKFSRKAFADGLRRAYTCGYADSSIALEFFRDKSNQKFVMSDEEIARLKTFPETITIYRGTDAEEQENGNYGISWTISQEVAEFFAFRTQTENRVVLVSKVSIDNILAYFENRKEYEVIVDIDDATVLVDTPTPLFNKYYSGNRTVDVDAIFNEQ